MTDKIFDTSFVRDGELIIFVTPGSLDGFTEQVTGVPLTASIDFVAGPAVPPAVGSGSVQFAIGANGNGTAVMANTLYDQLPLADLAFLRYSTYVSAFGSGGQGAPYLLLDINLTGGTSVDEQLFFEPVYQNGTYPGDPVPDQGTLALNTWQTWDAMIGGWHTGGGPPLITLTNYIAANPGATIVNSSGGGLQVAAGGAAPAWNNFVGNVNPLQVGDTDTCIIYNFGPTAGPATCR